MMPQSRLTFADDERASAPETVLTQTRAALEEMLPLGSCRVGGRYGRQWTPVVSGVYIESDVRWVQIAREDDPMFHIVLRIAPDASLADAVAALDACDQRASLRPHVVSVTAGLAASRSSNRLRLVRGRDSSQQSE